MFFLIDFKKRPIRTATTTTITTTTMRITTTTTTSILETTTTMPTVTMQSCFCQWLEKDLSREINNNQIKVYFIIAWRVKWTVNPIHRFNLLINSLINFFLQRLGLTFYRTNSIILFCSPLHVHFKTIKHLCLGWVFKI